MKINYIEYDQIKTICKTYIKRIVESPFVKKIEFYLLEKYLFVFLLVLLFNFIDLDFDNYLRDVIISFFLLIPVAMAFSDVLKMELLSTKLRLIFLLAFFVLYGSLYLDIYSLFVLALFCVAFLILRKNNNKLVSTPFIFLAVSLDTCASPILTLYFVILYIKKKYMNVELDNKIDERLIIASVITILLASIEGKLIELSVVGDFKLNLSYSHLLYVPKIRMAFFLAFCFTWYYGVLKKNNILIESLTNELLFISVLYLNSFIVDDDLLTGFVFTITIFYCVKNNEIIKHYTMKINKEFVVKYLLVLSSVVALRQIVLGMFYDGDRSINFLYTQYYMSYYHFGFIQRGVLGTILEMLFGYNISQNSLVPFLHVLMIILRMLLFAFACLFMFKYSERGKKIEIIFFGCLICLLPYYCCYPMDYINLFLGFVCICLAINNRMSIILIPIICLIAMCIHQVFIVLVYPMVFSVLIYRTFIENESHYVRNLLVSITTFGIITIAFIYFTFFNAQSISLTLNEVVSIIRERSGNWFPVEEDLLQYVYLDKNNQHFSFYSAKIWDVMYKNLSWYLLMVLPLVLVYLYAYIRSANKEYSMKKKISYYFCMISILSFVPLFIRDTDFGRWGAHICMIITVMPALLLVLQPPSLRWYDRLKTNGKFIALLIVILLLLMPEHPDFELKKFEILF